MDTGVVAIAFFGVRGHSFEDNEYRAAHVALAIVSALKRYDLRAKCGVTVGVGFCGLVGAPNRSVPASRATSCPSHEVVGGFMSDVEFKFGPETTHLHH